MEVVVILNPPQCILFYVVFKRIYQMLKIMSKCKEGYTHAILTSLTKMAEEYRLKIQLNIYIL